MRVAVQHTDPAHPNAGVFAFRLGRVQGHTDPITGKTSSADERMVALLDQARAEYPEVAGYAVRPERIVAVPTPHPETGELITELGEEHGVAEWQPIDETALRARASGEPVEVGPAPAEPAPEVAS